MRPMPLDDVLFTAAICMIALICGVILPGQTQWSASLGDPQKQLLQFFRTRVDRVVPFRMERVAADVESLHFGIGDLDALLIGPFIERTLDLEPGFSGGGGDQLDHCSAADEWLGAPVLRDMAEQPV